jgi:hypothetical protein
VERFLAGPPSLGVGTDFGGPAQKWRVSLLPTTFPLRLLSSILFHHHPPPPPNSRSPLSIYFMAFDVFTLTPCCTAASALHLALQSEFITRYTLLWVPIRHGGFRPDSRVRSWTCTSFPARLHGRVVQRPRVESYGSSTPYNKSNTQQTWLFFLLRQPCSPTTRKSHTFETKSIAYPTSLKMRLL